MNCMPQQLRSVKLSDANSHHRNHTFLCRFVQDSLSYGRKRMPKVTNSRLLATISVSVCSQDCGYKVLNGDFKTIACKPSALQGPTKHLILINPCVTTKLREVFSFKCHSSGSSFGTVCSSEAPLVT